MNHPKIIIVHCSASPNNKDIGTAEIRKMHLDRGWNDIGYHYVIRRSGELEIARPIHIMGAHVKGMNKDSIGICMIGLDKFEPEQFDTLLELYTTLNKLFHILPDKVYGHYEFTDRKTCPNIEMNMLRELLRTSIIS